MLKVQKDNYKLRLKIYSIRFVKQIKSDEVCSVQLQRLGI